MLQIYDEVVSDLLAPANAGSKALAIREDPEQGCVVEGIREIKIQSAEDALKAMKRSAAARRVGETRLNAESSRSHT